MSFSSLPWLLALVPCVAQEAIKVELTEVQSLPAVAKSDRIHMCFADFAVRLVHERCLRLFHPWGFASSRVHPVSIFSHSDSV